MGSVNYANMPLEYQYLSQFHGFPNPVAGTPLGQKFGLTTQKNTYNNPRTAGAFTPPMQQPQPYMQQMASPQMVTPQVATPSVPVNIGVELGLDETAEPEAEPEVADAATNQTAAENQDRQGNMAGSMINVPGMGQTAYMPGQTAGQMGQMPGLMGQMTGQTGQMGQMANQMGQMFGQMGQLGQMGGQMASMLRRQGGHQNQFMGGLSGMMNQHNPYPQNSMWPQHS